MDYGSDIFFSLTGIFMAFLNSDTASAIDHASTRSMHSAFALVLEFGRSFGGMSGGLRLQETSRLHQIRACTISFQCVCNK